MRVYLQDKKNRLYYASQSFPLGDSDWAMNFASVGAAAKLALERRLTEMQFGNGSGKKYRWEDAHPNGKK